MTVEPKYETPESRQKYEKSIFDDDDDDLFGPPPLPKINKKSAAPKQKVISIFDDSDSDNDLFSNANSGSRSQPAVSSSQTTKKSIFDDEDDDIFGNLKKDEQTPNKQIQLNKETKAEEKTKISRFKIIKIKFTLKLEIITIKIKNPERKNIINNFVGLKLRKNLFIYLIFIKNSFSAYSTTATRTTRTCFQNRSKTFSTTTVFCQV